MHNSKYEYGLWPVVIFNIFFFGFFIFSFLLPRRKREWRSLGLTTAFLVALFTEMYGFPLTIYILSPFLEKKLGSGLLFRHLNGHIWGSLLGFSIFGKILICTIGGVFIALGLILMGRGWKKIYKGSGELVTDGIYNLLRHPQYLGLFLVIFGFLVQWPTIITLLMAPLLFLSYYTLAKREERELKEQFGENYILYAQKTPAFLPPLTRAFHKGN